MKRLIHWSISHHWMVLACSVLLLVGNILSDVIVAFVDPRIRFR